MAPQNLGISCPRPRSPAACGTGSGSCAATTPDLVRVVPAVPTFPVDGGFVYRVPEGIGPVTVGNIVRVPLSGRRVRGYVIGAETVAPPRVKDVLSVSSGIPVFDEQLLATLQWAARHYVAPLSAVLGKSAPPNLARAKRPTVLDALPPVPPIPDLISTASGSAGRAGASHYLVGSGPWVDTIAALAHGPLQANRSVMVVAPTVVEARELVEGLNRYGNRVLLATSVLPDADVTRTWVQAATTPGTLLVGTREVAFWPVAAVALVILVEEGRRAMKAPQSPTFHVRDVVITRGRRERFGVVLCGAVPTAEALAFGARVHEPSGRAWPVTEITDRGSEPPGAGVILQHTRQTIAATAKRGGRVLVFVPRRGYAPAFSCVSCRTLRRCPICGAGPDPSPNCPRCGHVLGACAGCGGSKFQPLGVGVGRVVDDLRRSLGSAVGGPEDGTAVVVANERELPGLGLFDLAVAVDADGLLLSPTYRAEENALRVLARVVGRVRRGAGHRGLIQTALPDHRVMEALRRGRPLELMRAIVAERRAGGFPPGGEVLAIEVGDVPESADADLRRIAGDDAMVLGPAEQHDRVRWLVQGGDLASTKDRLRPLVQRWRDGSAKVRVDADPVDL